MASLLPRSLTLAWASRAQSLHEARAGGFTPSGARVTMNTFGPWPHVPLPPFTPGFAHGFLGKARALSLLTRGANGGTTMHDLNRVQRIGHVGQDPEVTYTATGTARTTFSVATSVRWKDAAGQMQEAT